MTLLIMILTFSYAASKLIDLVQKKDPFISQSLEKNFYDANLGLNLNQANFRFAIGVQTSRSLGKVIEAKNDPRFIKWYASLKNYKDNFAK